MPSDSPPKYEVDDPSSLAPRWWDVRAWSKKTLAIVGAGLIVLIIVVVVVPVEVSKNNAYPNYSPLNYSLKDTCESISLALCFMAGILCTSIMEIFREARSSPIFFIAGGDSSIVASKTVLEYYKEGIILFLTNILARLRN